MKQNITKGITKAFAIKNKLIDCLKAFKGAHGDSKEEKVSNLTEQFEAIAPRMIYGGHFEVIGGGEIVRQIYIHTVEFYYHEESNDENAVHDYIVYHRNALEGENKYPKYPKEVETFPIGSLNAHQSGVDITFEGKNKNYTYRASALIRAFKIKEGGKEIVDNRSTYLYDYLFKNAVLPITIHWEKDIIEANVDLSNFPRKNVYKYDLDNKNVAKLDEVNKRPKKMIVDGKKIQDDRPWAFSRNK